MNSEFEEITPTSFKIQNAGLSGASKEELENAAKFSALFNEYASSSAKQNNIPAFDQAQYESNSSNGAGKSANYDHARGTVIVDSLNPLDQEQEQTPFINFLKQRNTTNYIKPVNLEAKRAAKRKAQRKARRAAR